MYTMEILQKNIDCIYSTNTKAQQAIVTTLDSLYGHFVV